MHHKDRLSTSPLNDHGANTAPRRGVMALSLLAAAVAAGQTAGWTLASHGAVHKPREIATAKPVIAPGGVVNGASSLGLVAPGSLATVYGSNLADGSYPAAPEPRFPATLGGVAVTVNGVRAPLIYMSPSQINFQVPWATSPGMAATIRVTRDGVDSDIAAMDGWLEFFICMLLRSSCWW
jgi:hypothetical protein